MRFRMAGTTAVVALLAALAALAMAMGAGAGVAGATGNTFTPSWSAIQTYSSLTVSSGSTTGSVTLTTSLTCPSYGRCVAVGVQATTGGESPVVILENGAGQWGQPTAAPLPGNAGSGEAEFTSVACTSPTTCIAVGAYATSTNGTQPLAVPFTVSGSSATFGIPEQVSLPSNALTTSSQGAFLSSVSCGTSSCTAVGSYETNAVTPVWTAITATPGGGGAWTAAAVTAPAGAANDNVLNAISCPSTGACEGVGTYADGSNHTQLWAVQVNNGVAGTAQPVTVSGASTVNATTPSPSTFLDLHPGLVGVSCPSAGECTAVGTIEGSSSAAEGIAVPITAGTVGQSATLGGVSESFLDGVWCSDATDCTAVGLGVQPFGSSEVGVRIAAAETSGSWSAPVTLQGPSVPSGATEAITVAEAVGCTAPGVCVTSGLSTLVIGSGPSETETEGSFFAYSAIPPTVTTSSLPAASVGKPYKATLQSSGGIGTGSWAVTLGSLPPGLTLNAATGVISGTPTTAGQNGFVVTTTNAGPPSLSATVSLSLTVGPVASVALAYSKVSGDAALVVFGCSGARCEGRFKLTGIERRHGKTPTAVDARAKQHGGKRTVTLASGSYSINAGAGKAINVKLNATGLKLLHELGKISGRLTLTPSGSKTPALIKKLTFKSSRAG